MAKFLIVDDSRSQIMLNSKIVKDYDADAEIVSFRSPEEALETFRQSPTKFDFALLDYNMQGMTGVELAVAIVGLNKDIIQYNNIVLLSANVQSAVQEKANELGIRFLGKPVTVDKLASFTKAAGESNVA